MNYFAILVAICVLILAAWGVLNAKNPLKSAGFARASDAEQNAASALASVLLAASNSREDFVVKNTRVYARGGLIIAQIDALAERRVGGQNAREMALLLVAGSGAQAFCEHKALARLNCTAKHAAENLADRRAREFAAKSLPDWHLPAVLLRANLRQLINFDAFKNLAAIEQNPPQKQ